MFFTARFDPAHWYPKPDEGLFEYWASLTPMAPFFGVAWRFGDLDLTAPLKADAPLPSPVRPDVEDAEIVETPALDALRAVPETEPETVPEPEAKPEPEPEAAPESSRAPELDLQPQAPAEPDDLTVIKGIGPKMAGKLAEAGITTYAQIAAWTEAEVAHMDEALGGMPGAIARQDWVGQAKALAS